MADHIDEASEVTAMHLRHSLSATRAAAAAIPAGVPGVCDDCGDDSPRLVHGRCAPCRDRKRR